MRISISYLRWLHNLCVLAHTQSLGGTDWDPPNVLFNGYRRLLSWGYTFPSRSLPALVFTWWWEEKFLPPPGIEHEFSLRLTLSLFTVLSELLRLYVNFCIYLTDFLLVSPILYVCEFLANPCDFYCFSIFSNLNVM